MTCLSGSGLIGLLNFENIRVRAGFGLLAFSNFGLGHHRACQKVFRTGELSGFMGFFGSVVETFFIYKCIYEEFFSFLTNL